MSGLIERIVRRRRAKASRRLGPPEQPDGAMNGGAPDDAPAPSLWAPENAVKTHRRAPEDGTASERWLPKEATATRWLPEEAGTSHQWVPEELAANGGGPGHAEEPLEEAPIAAAEPDPAPVDEEAETISFPALADQPAAQEPEPAAEIEDAPRTRTRIRRRIRYLRALREVQLRDLGGFQVELERFGAQRPELVHDKLKAALATDAELRVLQRSLDADQPLRELREAGIGGACANCGAVHGSEDRFCAACGEPVRALHRPSPVAPPAQPNRIAPPRGEPGLRPGG